MVIIFSGDHINDLFFSFIFCVKVKKRKKTINKLLYNAPRGDKGYIYRCYNPKKVFILQEYDDTKFKRKNTFKLMDKKIREML